MVRKHLQYYITTFPPNICTNLKCVCICRGSAVCLGCLRLFKSGNLYAVALPLQVILCAEFSILPILHPESVCQLVIIPADILVIRESV